MRARSIFGMMAKKEVEVNMEEGQMRWPNGHWNFVSRDRLLQPV
jgi:hypothetical protein